MAKYLSNRQQNLKIGIVSYTEDKTVLEVIGNVGIGTTKPTSKLTVVGNARITGILTIGTSSIVLDGTDNKIYVGSGVTISATEILIGSNIISSGGFSGNATFATNAGISTFATNAGVSTYATNAGIATFATNAGIATNLKGGVIGNIPYQSAADTTAFLTNGASGTILQSNGVGNAPTWATPAAAAGAITGLTISDENNIVSGLNSVSTLNFVGSIVSVASTAGIATITFLDYVSNAGIATFATNAGISTFATNAGIATFATNAGIATFATNAGISTFATNAGIATFATNAGIATFATNAGIATFATNAGISTFATNAGIATFATNAGIATFATNAGIATFATNAGVSTYSDNAGIATFATSAGIATFATNAGIATFATNAGVSTYATNAGVSTYATNAGVSTYATNAGIATFATNAGIATNLKGGVIGNINYQSAADTTAFLTNGASGTILQSNGVGNAPTWATPAAAAGAITGLTIRDENNIVSGLNSVSTLNFVGSIVSVASTAGIATITFLDYVSNAGIATFATNAGIATFATNAGISTFATNAGIATFATNAGISTFTSEWILTANDSNNYIFTGPGLNGAQNDPVLYLVRGQQYKFTNTMGAHPFRIQSTPNGSAGTEYSVGITNNNVSNGTLTWNVQFDVPSVLYYQCTSHGSMGGKIYIIDSSGSNYATSAGIATTVTNIPNLTGAIISIGTTTSLGSFTSAQLAAALSDETGYGVNVFATSPSLETPILGTPSSGTLTSCTGLPLTTGVIGTLPVANGGTGVTVSTGTGSVVLSTSPTLVTPALGAATATSIVVGSGVTITASGIIVSSGIITASSFTGNASSATFATNAGIATFATNAGIATNLKGGVIGNIPYQSAADTTAFLTNGASGTILQSNGVGNAPTWATPVSNAITGLTIRDENNIVSGLNSVSTLNFVGPIVSVASTAGIATITFLDYVSNAGIATFATNAGIATFATNAGISTFATNAGIATFATNAGIATNLKGGVIGNIPYQSTADTTAFLTNGGSGTILQSNGVGNAPTWVTPAAADAITGLTIRDEGTIVGGANSISALNFVGSIVSVASTAGIATITFLDYVSNAGIATFATNAGIATYTSEWILGANGSSDYTFTGPGLIGAENDPVLYLVRGQQYKFTNTMGAHPFRIQSTPNGTAGAEYNDGIFNNNVQNGTLTWNVQFDAPNILYYQCTAHSGMGGKIYIIDAGIGPDISINTTGIITASSFTGNASSATFATNAGIATNIKGGVIGNINYQSAADTTAFLTNGGSGTILQSNGVGNVPTWVTPAPAAAITGLTIRDENNIVSGLNSVSTLNFVGSIVSVASTAGIATITFLDYVSNAGIATFATNAGISTNLKGGLTGNIPYQSGINTTAFLTNGNSGTILQSNGVGNAPTWVTPAPAGAITGLTIRDEGTIVGGANSISALNFVGSIVSVASTAGIATITFAAPAGEFNTGITSSVQIKPLSFESSVFTFPTTAGKQYVIETINVANIDTSVGIGTTVNIIASIQDSTGEQTYIAYNIPIVNGGLIELLKNPIVAGPSDVIRMWATDGGYSGVNTALEVYMNYGEYTSTEYIRKYASTVSIATTNITGIFTSTTYASVIKSIHLANRTDSGDYPVSVMITNGVTTTFLAKDLIIPRYSTIDILDRPKRVEINGKISIGVGQTSTIDVIIAGKQITS